MLFLQYIRLKTAVRNVLFNSKNISFTRFKRNFVKSFGTFIKGYFENVTKLLQNVKITI